jgi:trehalose synthase
VSGETGWLLEDPRDLDEYANAVERLLADPAGADRMGANAQERARSQFLADRHLSQWAGLFAGVVNR